MKFVIAPKRFTAFVLGLAIAVLVTNETFGQESEQAKEMARRQTLQFRQMQQQLEEQKSSLAAQLAALQAEVAKLRDQELQVASEAAKAASSIQPGNKQVEGRVQVIRLTHARPDRVLSILKDISGNKIQKSAIDQAANSIIISAREEDYEQIKQLIRVLDVPADRPPFVERRAETLQIRMMWLAGSLPETAGLADIQGVEPRVLEAVKKLGLSDPRVICQHVTNVAKSWSEPAKFEFVVPTVLGPNRLAFQGGGTLTRNNLEQFEVRLSTNVNSTVGRETQTAWRMDGSVAMPLRHYMIMGTTNLVLESTSDRATTCPAALVIYVDEVSPIVIPAAEEPPANEASTGQARGTRTSPTRGNNDPFGPAEVDPRSSRGLQPSERRSTEDNPFK